MLIRKQHVLCWFIFVLVMMTGLFSGCSSSKKEVVIASKNFTENIILSELMAQVIEAHTEISVIRKQNMGATFVVFSALESGEIDMYPDYTGTLYQANLKQTERLTTDETYAYVRQAMAEQNIVVMESFGFNNTYAIGLLKEKADKLGVKTISDLRNHPDLILGFDHEFVQRTDGALEMIKFYDLSFTNELVQMEIGLKLFALAEGKVDITDAFSTDSKLLRYDVTVLEDDKNFFPPYYAVAVVKAETLKNYPEIEKELQKLVGLISEKEMIELNYAVEDDKRSVNEVAVEFLLSKGIVQ